MRTGSRRRIYEMAAIDGSIVQPSAAGHPQRSVYLRLAQAAFCAGVPLLVWLSPLPVAGNTKAALVLCVGVWWPLFAF
jgi:hypothetical protein